tara:strand:- start:2706 stop:3137 length:432 start_codon:yes stop_codon:yes gene_type:complete
MIEELRPLQYYRNKDIVPVVLLLQRIDDSENNTITIADANKLLGKYGRSLEQLKYLEAYGVIGIETVQTSTKEYGIVTLPRKYYDEAYNENLIENCKIILKDLVQPVDLYNLASIFITRYPVEDMPYIIELLRYESIIEKIYC